MTTLLDKLWSSHEILQRDDGTSLLWVDRHFVHEGSHHAFAKLQSRGATVAEPSLTFAITDHYAPTRGPRNVLQIADATIARMIKTLADNANKNAIALVGIEDSQQGIVHVVGPELGLTLPGLLINCGDSHTSTHGAFGALAFGIGATEVAHVLSTQTLWQKKPKAMRLQFNGELQPGVTAKDIALHWIASLGSGGAVGHAIEYSGSAVSSLSMEARMTLCNLSIEGGARLGMVAPDTTTFRYLQGRAHVPAEFESACEVWQQLSSDTDAKFDRDVNFNAADIAPFVTWGTRPDMAVAVGDKLPAIEANATLSREDISAAMDYMGLKPGQSIEGLAVDQVFIGSCTNGRLEDLRIAASVIKGNKTKVPGLVSPGSSAIKRAAEKEGLDRIFTEAGLEWAESGCSMCVGMNGDTVDAGKRCASSTNRNFRGRQGKGSRTHLMSPAMVAAAAIYGRIVDVRELPDTGFDKGV